MNTLAPSRYARAVRTLRGEATSDGAGVRLTRVIGGPALPDLDPFLLLDEFGTDRPEDYIAGFPEHPHRGFETVTYMLDGRMRHRDNHGNEGLLTPGAVQWMTAGRGLVHSEMPEQQEGRMRGFQLWVNLPAKDKMTQPRYQEFPAGEMPVVQPGAGVAVKVIAGDVDGVRGPISQPATDPLYLDIALDAGQGWEYTLPEGHNAFAYVFEGEATVGDGEDARRLDTHEMAVLGGGAVFKVTAAGKDARLILVAGRPLREPVARYGPFVMNNKQELMQAFVDFQEGRF
ncbi:pirin family protein [Lysobacter solisilvae (ex Woo and Kim 2020)]|uniref:Pirin family protein n=1 Tax=Agrilutibacter terrestris TaxID=2865112 RepID=A0A7H0FVP6_9GAMM|nr:pirin family protein [Lysobacter terrestris]QNP40112.1 pirin family protein [Lysobacter terrestris]